MTGLPEEQIKQGAFQPVLAERVPVGVGEVLGRGRFQERQRQRDPHPEAARVDRRGDQRRRGRRRVPHYEHAFKLAKGTLGLTAAKVRDPGQADRWARIVMAAYAQLLLALPLAADLRCAGPGKNSPAPAGRWPGAGSATGFATSAASWAHPPVSRNPPAPAPAGPKAAAKGQLPATFSPAKPTCHTRKNLLRPGRRLKLKLRGCSPIIAL